MGKLIRKIRFNRWSRKDSKYDWIPEGDTISDPLPDFWTTEGDLSLWFIEDDDSNLPRVVAALACRFDKLEVFDFAYVNFDVVNKSYQLKKSKGGTPDKEANRNWHYDVRNLTARGAAELVTDFRKQGDVDRRYGTEIKKYIIESDNSGHLKVPRNIQKEIGD